MRLSSFILAYHGCDRELAKKIVLRQESVSISDNDYDSLGTGAYFWENDPLRALQWAEWIRKHPNHAKSIIFELDGHKNDDRKILPAMTSSQVTAAFIFPKAYHCERPIARGRHGQAAGLFCFA